jgi:hypothetical protein
VKNERSPTTYFTREELRRTAAEKFEEATALSPMSGGIEYRAYVVGPDGHFIGFHAVVAANDDAAFEHARQFVDGHDVELWSGARFVAKLKSGE